METAMMKRLDNNGFVHLLGMILMLLTISAQAALMEKRVALVIGNGAYHSDIPVLPNASNDSRAVAKALMRLGFEVHHGEDLTEGKMGDLLAKFARSVAGADVGLFFYAGHGLQFEGENYLIPVDATRMEHEWSIELETLPISSVLRAIKGAKMKLIFLDACRDNPLPQTLAEANPSRSLAVSQGLVEIQHGPETFVAFAAEPGKVAADGDTRHSPFTQALLRNIETPGLEVNDLLTKIRSRVVKDTGGEQTPVHFSKLTKDFYFEPRSAEIVHWENAQQIRDPLEKKNALLDFVERFPESQLVLEAKKQLREVEPQIAKLSEIEAVNRQLARCENYLNQNYLDMATACYRQVLEQDPGNDEALEGINTVMENYASLVEQSISQGHRVLAEKHLQRMEEIKPTSFLLPALYQKLGKLPAEPKVRSEPIRRDSEALVASPESSPTGEPTPEQLEAALRLQKRTKRNIQIGLKSLGFDPRGADGIFGRNTRAAIKLYQQNAGYLVTGFLTSEQASRLASSGREEQARRRVEAERRGQTESKDSTRASEDARLRRQEARQREQALREEELQRIEANAQRRAQEKARLRAEEVRLRAEAQRRPEVKQSPEQTSSTDEWESMVQSVEEEAYRLGDRAYEWWYGSETD
jgi:hypothetical protein